jgi:hypothetical protein
VEQFPVGGVPADKEEAFLGTHDTGADSALSAAGSAVGVVAFWWR